MFVQDLHKNDKGSAAVCLKSPPGEPAKELQPIFSEPVESSQGFMHEYSKCPLTESLPYLFGLLVVWMDGGTG